MGDKKTVIIDSSSAILLYKAGIFNCAATAYDLTVTASVAEELTRGGHDGSDQFKEAINSGLIKAAKAGSVTDGYASLSRLGPGERDSIILYLSGFGRFVIIDDGRGARMCRDMSIPFINALLVVRILRDCGIIEEKEFTEIFGTLVRVGRYTGEIISFARECENNRLTDFYPLESSI